MHVLGSRRAIWFLIPLSLVLSCFFPITTYARNSCKDSGQPNSSLRSFLKDYLNTIGGSEERSTRISLANLRNKIIVVYVSGPMWCGSGGCMLLTLKRTGHTFTVLGKTTNVHPPIRLVSSSLNGKPELGVVVAGGGILHAYEAVLPFSAKGYPENATMPPSKPITLTQGRAIITCPGASPLYR